MISYLDSNDAEGSGPEAAADGHTAASAIMKRSILGILYKFSVNSVFFDSFEVSISVDLIKALISHPI
jgi:hypothetical protein